MEEWPPIWRVAANKLNMQSRTANKGWSYSLGVGRGANNSSPVKKKLLRITHGQGASSGQLAGACEYGNELSGSIKCGEFLD